MGENLLLKDAVSEGAITLLSFSFAHVNIYHLTNTYGSLMVICGFFTTSTAESWQQNAIHQA